MKKGFTLIELLVVIAIIAILAAILFPVFASAREKARQTTCASNEKQMALALLQYVQDYDEKFPLWQYTVNGSPYDWENAANTYVKTGNNAPGMSGGVWHCPDFPDVEPAEYGMNRDIIAPAALGNISISLARLNTPSDTAMIMEKGHTVDPGGTVNGFYSSDYVETDQSAWAGSVAMADGSCNPSPSVDQMRELAYDYDETPSGPHSWWLSPGDLPRYRHNGFTNVAWCDGHVKSMKKTTLLWVKNIYIPGASGQCW